MPPATGGCTSCNPPRTVSDHEPRCRSPERKRNNPHEQTNQGGDLHPSSRISGRIDSLFERSGICGRRATTRLEDVEADWFLYSKYDYRETPSVHNNHHERGDR